MTTIQQEGEGEEEINTQRKSNTIVRLQEEISLHSSEIVALNPIRRVQNITPQEITHNRNQVPCATLTERVKEVENQLVKINRIVLFDNTPRTFYEKKTDQY